MNSNQNILTMVCLLVTASIFAQHTLSGSTKDQMNNEKLAGVSIYFPDLKKGTLSDDNGNYEIAALKKGIYWVEVSAMGYETIVEQIEIEGEVQLDFSLEESITELGDIIITGVTRATELKKNPVVIKTIDQQFFEQNSSTNLVDALKAVPGISSIGTGPNISKPVIRGLGFNRVIVLNNGMKQEGQQWGSEHGVEIDEYSIERVEIIKGPGSLLYGSDGIAGVLNFLPPKPPLKDETNTKLLTNYQSNNQLLGYSLAHAGNKNGFQWLGNFSNKYAGNYENDFDGKVLNSGFREFNGKISLGLNQSWGHSYWTVNSYNSKLGIVEGERDEEGNFVYENHLGEEVSASNKDLKAYKIGVPYQRINHFSVASNHYVILNKGSVHADFGFQNNRRREYEEAETPDEVGLSLSLNTFNYSFRYNFEKMKGWETSVGIGGMWQHNRNKGVEYLIPDYDLLDIGAFVFAQKNFGELTLAGGFRVDNRNMNAQELYLEAESQVDPELKFIHFNKNYQGISGSLGLSYQMNKSQTFKLNFSQGFRAPNIAELASNGRHEGTFRYEVGQPNLKSEISHQIDLAYYLNTEHLTLEVSPFVNFIDQYIFLEKSDQLIENEEGNEWAVFEYTAGNATLWGGELYMDWHPHPLDWLHVEQSFSYVQATQTHSSKDAKYLPFIPAPHYRGGLKAEFHSVNKNISNLYAQFYVDHFFAQNKVYRAYGTETPTAAYTLLSAGIGARFQLFNQKDFVQFSIHANNLTNKAYQSHLSRLKYASENPATGRIGVFDMGRNFGFKIVINLKN